MLEEYCEPYEDTVDPRVQVELERLNAATDEINKLEVELDEAKKNFRILFSQSRLRIQDYVSRLGLCIPKAKPYYHARLEAKQALGEKQKLAAKQEKATSAHSAAKEMVFLAEEGLRAEGTTFDHAWQEMLNHATMRVNDSEAERTECEKQVEHATQAHQMAQARVHLLQRTLKKVITKSRPYYELRAEIHKQLDEQVKSIKSLEKQVTETKAGYADTLRSLEQISDEIHQSRQSRSNVSALLTAERNRASNFIDLGDGGQSEKDTPGSCSSIPDTDVWSDFSEQPCTQGCNDDESECDSSLAGMPDSDSDTLSFEKERGAPKSNGLKTEEYGICSFPAPSEFSSCEASQWTEIKLSSSGEDEFVKMRAPIKSNDVEGFDIPYAPLTEIENETVRPVEKRKPENDELKTTEEDTKSRLPMTPSKMLNIRRQSLDVLWNNTTGEKVKEMLSQSIQKLNIGTINERRNSESKLTALSQELNYDSDDSEKRSFGRGLFTKKTRAEETSVDPRRASPLERRLSFLTVDDEIDPETMASLDLLTDDQLSALVLDQDLAELYKDIVP